MTVNGSKDSERDLHRKIVTQGELATAVLDCGLSSRLIAVERKGGQRWLYLPSSDPTISEALDPNIGCARA
jgi:hypothetical protein